MKYEDNVATTTLSLQLRVLLLLLSPTVMALLFTG